MENCLIYHCQNLKMISDYKTDKMCLLSLPETSCINLSFNVNSCFLDNMHTCSSLLT